MVHPAAIARIHHGDPGAAPPRRHRTSPSYGVQLEEISTSPTDMRLVLPITILKILLEGILIVGFHRTWLFCGRSSAK